MNKLCKILFFFFSSRRRHTRSYGDWSSDVCSSDLVRMSRRISSTAMPGDVRLWVLRGASSLWPPLLYQRFDSLLFPEGDMYLFDCVYCTRDAMTCQCSGRMCQGGGKPAPVPYTVLPAGTRAGASPRPYPIR